MRRDASIESALIPLLRSSLKKNFGDYSLGLIDRLELCEYHPNLSIAIIKCNLEIYKQLCYVLVTTGSADRADVKFTVLSVSGILKKCKRKFLSLAAKEPTGAKNASNTAVGQ